MTRTYYTGIRRCLPVIVAMAAATCSAPAAGPNHRASEADGERAAAWSNLALDQSLPSLWGPQSLSWEGPPGITWDVGNASSHGPDAGNEYPRFPAVMPDLWNTITDADFNYDRGQALEEYLNQFSISQVNNYGLALLTMDEIFGTPENDYEDALCEAAEVLWHFEDDISSSMRYEAGLELNRYVHLMGDIEPYIIALSQQCIETLATSGGNVGSVVFPGGCLPDEETTFFPGGSDCRECLEVDGDYAACLGSGACVEEAQDLTAMDDIDGNTYVFEVFVSEMVACAPDWTVPAYLMAVPDEAEGAPDAFDHGAWTRACVPFWDVEAQQPVWSCQGDPPSEYQWWTVAEGVFGRASYIREEGTEQETWKDRFFYVSAIEFETGDSVRNMWLGAGHGIISTPILHEDTNGDGIVGVGDANWGTVSVGWGLNPAQLRPDGTDLDSPNDTKAREWISALLLKVSTTISGVPVFGYNHNCCEPDSWVGPDERGRYSCTQLQNPQGGWLEDCIHLSADDFEGLTHARTMATIASTGLPDPIVPGGVVLHIAGSPALANPDFEDCRYPHTFEPDQLALPNVPDVYPEGETGALSAHTYRFGKDADQDIRFVMHSNWVRGYCPEDGEP